MPYTDNISSQINSVVACYNLNFFFPNVILMLKMRGRQLMEYLLEMSDIL